MKKRDLKALRQIVSLSKRIENGYEIAQKEYKRHHNAFEEDISDWPSLYLANKAERKCLRYSAAIDRLARLIGHFVILTRYSTSYVHERVFGDINYHRHYLYSHEDSYCWRRLWIGLHEELRGIRDWAKRSIKTNQTASMRIDEVCYKRPRLKQNSHAPAARPRS